MFPAFPEIVRIFFKHFQGLFKDYFQNLQGHNLVKKNIVVLPTYTMQQKVKFFKENTLIQIVLCVKYSLCRECVVAMYRFMSSNVQFSTQALIEKIKNSRTSKTI